MRYSGNDASPAVARQADGPTRVLVASNGGATPAAASPAARCTWWVATPPGVAPPSPGGTGPISAARTAFRVLIRPLESEAPGQRGAGSLRPHAVPSRHR